MNAMADAIAKASLQCRRQSYFRYEDEYLAVSCEDLLSQREVDLCFAAAGDAFE